MGAQAISFYHIHHPGPALRECINQLEKEFDCSSKVFIQILSGKRVLNFVLFLFLFKILRETKTYSLGIFCY